MRRVAGAIIGVIVSLAIVVGVRLLAIMAHAMPGMNFNDPQAMTAWLQSAPTFALALFVAAWLFGALAGGWAALRISHWVAAVWIVAGLDLVLSAATLAQFAYPLWMKIGLIAAPLLGGWLATRLPRPAPRADEPIDG